MRLKISFVFLILFCVIFLSILFSPYTASFSSFTVASAGTVSIFYDVICNAGHSADVHPPIFVLGIAKKVF
jgi:hypothetical protein